jgi:glycosyltransferase involved in cell wall biosynthesis
VADRKEGRVGIVLLIEPSMSGHHAGHLRWCIGGAVSQGHRVLLGTTPGALNHTAFGQIRADMGAEFDVVQEQLDTSAGDPSGPSNVFGLWRSQRVHYEFSRNVFARAGHVDYVFMPYLDSCAYSIAILGTPFGDTPWSGTVMRPSFHFTRQGVVAPRPSLAKTKEWLFFRLLRARGLQRLFTNDETLLDFVRRKKARYLSRLDLLPDPVTERAAISKQQGRAALDLPSEATLVLLVGTVTARKGVKALVESMEQSDWPSDVHLVLAGKQDQEIVDYLRGANVRIIRKQGRLHLLDRFLTEAEIASAFAATDFVWCGYEGHYQMSGVLAQAGHWGKPVIACREGLIGRLTRHHGMGVVLADAGPRSIVEAVGNLHSDPGAVRRFGTAGQRAFASHTVAHAESQVRALWA